MPISYKNRICRNLLLQHQIPALVAGLQLSGSLGICDSTITEHFVRDISSILNSSVSDTWLVGPVVIVCAALTLIVILLFSVDTIRKFPLSSKGKRPFYLLFHMIVVTSGSCIIFYIKPSAWSYYCIFFSLRTYPHWCLVQNFFFQSKLLFKFIRDFKSGSPRTFKNSVVFCTLIADGGNKQSCKCKNMFIQRQSEHPLLQGQRAFLSPPCFLNFIIFLSAAQSSQKYFLILNQDGISYKFRNHVHICGKYRFLGARGQECTQMILLVCFCSTVRLTKVI